MDFEKRAKKLLHNAETFICSVLVKEHGIKNIKSAKETILSEIEPWTNSSSDSQLTLNDIFYRFSSSAQNANMRENVIGGSLISNVNKDSVDPIKRLGQVLFNFDPKKTLAFYGDDAEFLFSEIIGKLKPSGKLNRGPRCIWPKYCRTILDSSKYLATFKNGKEFSDFVQSTGDYPRLHSAIPLIISEEVSGIGFTLACDILKELGFSNFGKPDLHVKDILYRYSFIRKNSSDYLTHVTLRKIATSLGKSPFYIDKILWLVGSGKFRHGLRA